MQSKVKKVKSSTFNSKFKKLLIAKPDILHTFLSHSDINKYLEYLERRYDNFVTVHTLGVTYEGRQLKGIEIDWCCAKNVLALAKEQQQCNSKVARLKLEPFLMAATQAYAASMTNDSEVQSAALPYNRRNYVFIEGGTHAREWITISVALNCIYQLTERYIRNRELLEKLRFFIVPLVNPDGYEYTLQTNPRWRKNRRPTKNSKCIGTDCNRNYDFHWEKGPSKSNRSTYKGDSPFSEPETQALRNVLLKLSPHLLFFLSLHSYAQSIMYPWGYSKELPANWQHLEALAMSGRNAIKNLTGRKYRCGSISTVTKRTISGSIVDYAFGIVKAPYALVMELPSSEYGFQPPAEKICPLGNESWIGIREMCKCVVDLAHIAVPTVSENDK